MSGIPEETLREVRRAVAGDVGGIPPALRALLAETLSNLEQTQRLLRDGHEAPERARWANRFAERHLHEAMALYEAWRLESAVASAGLLAEHRQRAAKAQAKRRAQVDREVVELRGWVGNLQQQIAQFGEAYQALVAYGPRAPIYLKAFGQVIDGQHRTKNEFLWAAAQAADAIEARERQRRNAVLDEKRDTQRFRMWLQDHGFEIADVPLDAIKVQVRAALSAPNKTC